MAPRSKNIVAVRVREARRAAGLTQDQLAAQLARMGVGLDRAGVAKVETGIRRVFDYELKAFAQALGVTVDSLLGNPGEVRPPPDR